MRWSPRLLSAVVARLAGWLGIAGRSLRAQIAFSLGELSLAGAALFGLVHVIGGTLRDNPRAATFGVELASGSIVALTTLHWLVRRSATPD